MAGDFQLNFDIQGASQVGMESPTRSRVRYLPAVSVALSHSIHAVLSQAFTEMEIANLGAPKASAWLIDRSFVVMELAPGGTSARIIHKRTPAGSSEQVVRYYTLTTARPRAYYFGDRTTASVITGSTSTSRKLVHDSGDPVSVRGLVFFSS